MPYSHVDLEGSAILEFLFEDRHRFVYQPLNARCGCLRPNIPVHSGLPSNLAVLIKNGDMPHAFIKDCTGFIRLSLVREFPCDWGHGVTCLRELAAFITRNRSGLRPRPIHFSLAEGFQIFLEGRGMIALHRPGA